MNIQLTLAARYLWGRKLRTVLTTLAVMFGVLVIFGMNILVPSLLQAFTANALAASGQVDATVTHKTGEAFSPDLLDKVEAVDGVRVATGFLSRPLVLPLDYFDHDPNKADQVSTLSLVGLDPDTAQTLHNYSVTEGRFLQADAQEAAVITASLAEALGLKVGDALSLPTAQGKAALTIVGLRPARTLPGNEEVLVTLPEAQALLDQPDQINTIEANYNTLDEARRAEIQKAIEAVLGENYHLGALPSGAELLTNLRTGQAAVNLFGFLSLFMGGFIIFNTFRTVIAERRHDIGMLRAVGASRRTIVGLILTEGLLQGGVGTLVGMGLGYLMGAAILAALAGVAAQFIHLQVGAPVVSPGLVLITMVLGVGVTLLAGLLPAFSASRVTPLEALRPALADVYQRAAGVGAMIGAALIVLAVLALLVGNVGLVAVGGLLFLGGLVLIAPALVKPIASAFGALIALAFAREGTTSLAQGNLTRQPSRAAITASATMIGLALLVAVAGVITSITGGFLGLFRKSLGSDFLLIPPSLSLWGGNVGANENLAERLRAVDGVAAVSTIRFAATALDDKPISLLEIDPASFPQVAGLDFQAGDGQTAYSELAGSRSLILNRIIAAQTGLKVGDTVTLTTPEGEQTYRVAAVAGDYLNSKTPAAYVSQANLAADFHKTDDIFIQLNLAPGADRAAVEPKLKAIVADYPQFRFVSGQAFYDENRRLMEASFSVLYVLFAVFALPSLIAMLNTLAISVIERTREIGMLRAVGATQKQVRRMVLIEALLLAALGTAFGLLAGLYLGYLLMSALTAGGYPVTYSFPLAGLLAAIAIGLLFGVLAALLPARQAARMEIVKALRYE